MNIDKMKSNLQMNTFFFRECTFLREQEIRDGKLNIDVSKKIEKLANHKYNVSVITSIIKEDLRINVNAETVFTYDSDDYNNEETVINTNTVAIMFPFIRSQVTLMTSQPGMTPIVLPPINTQKLN